MNNLKFDQTVSSQYQDLVAEIWLSSMHTQQRFSGSMLQRELVKLSMDARIQIACQNRILFDGTILELAIEYLRDLPKLEEKL